LAISSRNLAFDLSLFEAKPEEKQRKNNIVELPRSRAAKNRVNSATVVFSLLFSAIIIFTIYINIQSQLQLSELASKISITAKALKESLSEETQLAMQLESQSSPKEIEERAENYGLGKRKDDQKEYISLSEEDKAEVKNEGNNFFVAILESFFKLFS
jgi:cell division protein FtsL